MKTIKYIILLLGLLLLSISCREKTKKVANEIENATQIVKKAKNISEEASAMQKNINELRKKEYLTKEQWESWLPKKLFNMPMRFSQINFMPGLGSCGASYNVGNKRIKVMIIDGAGEKGAGGVGPYRMSSKMEYDEEGSWGTTKTIEIDGHKAKLSSLKSGKYSISMFYNERFAVDIETHELEREALEQIVEELKLNKLL